MMCGTAENRVLEWRSTVALCQNIRKSGVLHMYSAFLVFFVLCMLNLASDIIDKLVLFW